MVSTRYPAVTGPVTVAGCCAAGLAWAIWVRHRTAAPALAGSAAELAGSAAELA